MKDETAGGNETKVSQAAALERLRQCPNRETFRQFNDLVVDDESVTARLGLGPTEIESLRRRAISFELRQALSGLTGKAAKLFGQAG